MPPERRPRSECCVEFYLRIKEQLKWPGMISSPKQNLSRKRWVTCRSDSACMVISPLSKTFIFTLTCIKFLKKREKTGLSNSFYLLISNRSEKEKLRIFPEA